MRLTDSYEECIVVNSAALGVRWGREWIFGCLRAFLRSVDASTTIRQLLNYCCFDRNRSPPSLAGLPFAPEVNDLWGR